MEVQACSQIKRLPVNYSAAVRVNDIPHGAMHTALDIKTRSLTKLLF